MHERMVTRVQCFEEDSTTQLTERINGFLHELDNQDPGQDGLLPHKWELVDIKFNTPDTGSPYAAMIIYKSTFDLFDYEGYMAKQKLSE